MAGGDLGELPGWAAEVRTVAVLTGAGISTDSGIPDFRGRQLLHYTPHPYSPSMTAMTGTTAAGTAAKKAPRRALGVIRLSVTTDQTTSPERQRELIEAKAKARGSMIIGWAEDPDVSASKVHPFKREKLGPWLKYRQEEYDEAIFWRIDRLVRKVTDMGDMLKWAKEHKKDLVSATEPFDTDSAIGKAVVYLITVFAEMESDATKTRVTGAHQHLRKVGRWAGGPPPYGYRVIKNLDGPGCVLAIDRETSDIIRWVVGRITEQDHVVNAIVGDLNRLGVTSPRDHVRELALARPDASPPEEPRKPGTWQQTSLRKILRSRALRGEVIHRPVVGKDDDDNELRGPAGTVTGPDGMPLTRAEPLITESDWRRLQKALDDAGHVKRRWQTPSGLLGVAYCSACASEPGGPAPLYLWQRHKRGKVYSYYRCKRAYKAAESPGRCTTLALRQEVLDELAERHFLAVAGSEQVMEKVYIHGEDHTEELSQVKDAMAKAREERDTGQYDYPGGDQEYAERIKALADRRKKLAALPQREATWDLVPTGKTFAEVWAAADVKERRRLMKDAGLTLRAAKLRPTPDWPFSDSEPVVWFRLDGELGKRAALAVVGKAADVPLPESDQWRIGKLGPDGAFYWSHRVLITGDPAEKYGPGHDPSDEELARWYAE
jgi:site-specific DNA recombinase